MAYAGARCASGGACVRCASLPPKSLVQMGLIGRSQQLVAPRAQARFEDHMVGLVRPLIEPDEHLAEKCVELREGVARRVVLWCSCHGGLPVVGSVVLPKYLELPSLSPLPAAKTPQPSALKSNYTQADA